MSYYSTRVMLEMLEKTFLPSSEFYYLRFNQEMGNDWDAIFGMQNVFGDLGKLVLLKLPSLS